MLCRAVLPKENSDVYGSIILLCLTRGPKHIRSHNHDQRTRWWCHGANVTSGPHVVRRTRLSEPPIAVVVVGGDTGAQGKERGCVCGEEKRREEKGRDWTVTDWLCRQRAWDTTRPRAAAATARSRPRTTMPSATSDARRPRATRSTTIMPTPNTRPMPCPL